ncbi:hypothetical protein GNF82_13645 [Clostridium perfringens]
MNTSRDVITSIKSYRKPDIQTGTLYAPGVEVDKDFKIAYANYTDIEAVHKAVEDVKALVNNYNKGVRDYNVSN